MTVQLQGRLATRQDTPIGDRCAIDRTVTLIGNRTAILLLREAFYGVTRFDHLWRRVGVTEAVAAQRLRELVEAGVLAKQPYREPGQRTRYEYVLTDAGHALLPTLIALLDWGNRYAPHGNGPTSVTHAGCGSTVRSELRCASGHDVAEADVVIRGSAG